MGGLLSLMGLVVGGFTLDAVTDKSSDTEDSNDLGNSDDSIAGDASDDTLFGLLGDDTLDGGDGDDTIDGGPGADVVDGGAGDDQLIGSLGDDTLTGGAGADTLIGGTMPQPGDSTIDESAGGNDFAPADNDDADLGAATVHGSNSDAMNDSPDSGAAEASDNGNDATFALDLSDESDNDDLHGGDGADVLIGGLGSDTMSGDAGVDHLEGILRNADGQIYAEDTDKADEMHGGADNDTIILGTGDHATGGGGADQFFGGTWVDPGDPAVIEDFDASADQLFLIHDASDTGPLDVTVTVAGADAIVALNGRAIMRVVGAAGIVSPGMIATVAQELAA